MAAPPEVIDGPVRDWLAARRQELNGRFRAARRRFPRLEPGIVLDLCRELLPALAGGSEPGTPELLGVTYDLILLHAGRGTLAPGGDTSATGVLLREAFPRLRRLLVSRPLFLPAALSNAVENLGGRGTELARGLAAVADDLPDGETLLNAGPVFAWRLGEVRLRLQSLELAAKLPPKVARIALGLPACPDAAVARIVAGLAADGWRNPAEWLNPKPTAPNAKAPWVLTARLGNFRGFDGYFLQPPLLLDAGRHASRHRFWVGSGDTTYRIDADVFGWVCRPDPSVDFPVRKAEKKARPPQLPAAAMSFAGAENLLAYTLADSFRVRILTTRGAA